MANAASSVSSSAATPRAFARGSQRWRAGAWLVALVAVHSLMWVLGFLSAGLLVAPRQIVAEFMSTLGLVAVSSNLILSARFRPIERALLGLDRVFVSHRLTGFGIAALVTAHFLAVPKSPGFVWSKPFGYTNLAFILAVVFLASAPRMPWRRLVPLKYQTWKATHRFNGLIAIIAIVHSRLAPTYVRFVPVLVAYVYGVAALGLCAWLYRELAFSRLGPFRAFAAAGVATLAAEGITEVTLADPSAPLPRRAGQFVFATFTAGPSREDHPFTVSSAPGSPMRLSVKASGDFTQALLGGPPVQGDVRIEGPYGAFDFARGKRLQLWLAGGIGITPFLSMAPALDGGREVTLVWSVRTAAEAVYRDELEAIAAANPNFTLVIHPTAELGHVDVRTHVDVARARELSVFLCGPVPMRKTMLRDLARLGVPRHEIYFEEFRLR